MTAEREQPKNKRRPPERRGMNSVPAGEQPAPAEPAGPDGAVVQETAAMAPAAVGATPFPVVGIGASAGGLSAF